MRAEIKLEIKYDPVYLQWNGQYNMLTKAAFINNSKIITITY